MHCKKKKPSVQYKEIIPAYLATYCLLIDVLPPWLFLTPMDEL